MSYWKMQCLAALLMLSLLFAANNTTIDQAKRASGADLQISSIELPGKIAVDQRVYGKIATRNTGIERTEETKTAYYIDSKLVNSISVPALRPGESFVGELTFICMKPGQYTLSAKADSEGKVNEQNEINNGKALRFICTSSASTPQNPAEAIVASMADFVGGLYSSLMSLFGVQTEAFAG